jgi:excisionase family DNA binding protein
MKPTRDYPTLLPRGLRIAEAAAYIGVTPWFVESKIRSGELPALKLCRHYTLLREDLDAFLDKQKEIRDRTSKRLLGRDSRKSSPAPSLIYLPRLLNLKEVAHVLNVSVRTVHTIIKTRQLTYSHVRGQLRFDPIHIDQYLRNRTIAAE